jgi:hypothetical protein
MMPKGTAGRAEARPAEVEGRLDEEQGRAMERRSFLAHERLM